MPFDDRDERASAIMPMMPFRTIYPEADGVVSDTSEEQAMILGLFALGVRVIKKPSKGMLLGVYR